MLQEKLIQYMEDNSLDIAKVSKMIGYSRSAVSQYLSGKYKSNPTKIEEKIIELLESKEITAKKMDNYNANDKTFFKSDDALKILAVAKDCQAENGLGCIIGTSGYGKSLALKKYAACDKVIYIECNSSMTKRDLLIRIEKGLGIPNGRGSIDSRINSVVSFLHKNQGYLIIFDEADKLISRLSIEKLEILRTIYDLCVNENDFDSHTVGILIAGEPQLRYNIMKWNDRYAKRIEQFYELKGLKSDEVVEYLQFYELTQKALDELIYRATNELNGCFRLLTRTLHNIERLGRGRKITTEIIGQASSMMML